MYRREGGQTSQHHEQRGSVERHRGKRWAVDRVVRFNGSLDYGEVSLKSDTEPAIIAFRNHVSERCSVEVVTEASVKGRQSNQQAC